MMNEKNLLIGYVGSSALPSVTPEDATKMTHINVAFGHVKDSRVTVANTRNLDTLSKLREYNPKLGILLSLGGWGVPEAFLKQRPLHKVARLLPTPR